MKCLICQKSIKPIPENPAAPFCSIKCKMADLNSWLTGGYAIPAEPVSTETDDEESTTPS